MIVSLDGKMLGVHSKHCMLCRMPYSVE